MSIVFRVLRLNSVSVVLGSSGVGQSFGTTKELSSHCHGSLSHVMQVSIILIEPYDVVVLILTLPRYTKVLTIV